MFKNKFLDEIGIDSTLKDMDLYEVCLEKDKLTKDAYDLFLSDRYVPGIILTSQRKYIGMVSRKRFFEILSRPYSLELYLKRTLDTLFHEFQFSSSIIPEDTFISDAVKIVLQRDSENIFEPVIVQSENTYKLLDIDQLLIAHSEVHSVLSNGLKKSMNYVNNLLNNTGEGLLTFGYDLVIDPLYSAECKVIFGEEIDDKFIPGLLFPENNKQKEYFSKILRSILNKNTRMEKELYMPLLPAEAFVNSKNIEIEYKIISDCGPENSEKIMLILTDVSEKKNLENKISEERNIFSMIVKVITDKEAFLECKKDYEYFYRHGIKELMNRYNGDNSLVHEISRIVHTFKGNFSQFDLANTVNKLHDLETGLIDLDEKPSSNKTDSLRDYVFNADFESWLNEDLKILKKYLGNTFTDIENTIILELDKLENIEKEILNLPKSMTRVRLLNELKILRAKPFKNLLKTYPDYVFRLAEKLEKPVNRFEIESDDTRVKENEYMDFCKTLVHVFRNAVVHGLETPDERLVKGKEETGNIKCSIKQDDTYIELRISDDGYGLDSDKIKRALLKKNIYSAEKMKTLNENELFDCIFMDSFSTKDNVTQYAGRGYGLAAVKNELEKINGKVRIISRTDKGTEFCFILPIII